MYQRFIFLAFLSLTLFILNVVPAFLSAQTTQEAITNESMMQELPEVKNTLIQEAHFMHWQGFGLMAFGLYLIGVSATIFAVHNARVSSLVPAEVIICLYVLWFVLFPYTIWLIVKNKDSKKLLIYEEVQARSST